MKKIVFALVALWLVVSGCTYNNLEPACYQGKFVMSSCCTGTSFIQMDSKFPIGKTMKVGDQEYLNVIQVPGYLNEGDVYLKLRTFDPEKDYGLLPIHCYCLIAVGLDVPVFVATAYSYTGCPEGNSN